MGWKRRVWPGNDLPATTAACLWDCTEQDTCEACGEMLRKGRGREIRRGI